MLTKPQAEAFEVVKQVLASGRALFFDTYDAGIPAASSVLVRNDHLVPQFGFVGRHYNHGGLLILGINPGNGHRSRGVRSKSDETMMPALYALKNTPSEENYQNAMDAQLEGSSDWEATSEINQKLTEAGVDITEIAYTNALPYRAENPLSNSAAIQRAVKFWVSPLVAALKPSVFVAFGKGRPTAVLKCARILAHPVVFDRELVQSHRAAKNVDFVARLIAALKIAR